MDYTGHDVENPTLPLRESTDTTQAILPENSDQAIIPSTHKVPLPPPRLTSQPPVIVPPPPPTPRKPDEQKEEKCPFIGNYCTL